MLQIFRNSVQKFIQSNKGPAVYSNDVLSVNPSKQHAGLIRLVFAFNAPSEIQKEKLTLSVTTSAGKLKKKFNMENSGFNFWVALCTHLLQNGEQTIKYIITNKKRQILFSGSQTLNIANDSMLANKVKKSVVEFNTPLFFDGECNSTFFDYNNKSLKPWFDKPDAELELSNMLKAEEVTDAQYGYLKQFLTEGYMVIDDLLENELIDQVSLDLDDAVQRKVEGYEYGSSQRIHGLHMQYDSIKKLWSHPKISEILKVIFRENSAACQTLSYVFGSQQNAHQDTIHLTSFPAGYMCGVWVALEDVKPNSGELFYYPKSHRLPRIYRETVGCARIEENVWKEDNWKEYYEKVDTRWESLVKEHQLKPEKYYAKKGSVLIWHENLMHGGSIRKDESISRKSIVSHHFADGSITFYDASGQPGPNTKA